MGEDPLDTPHSNHNRFKIAVATLSACVAILLLVGASLGRSAPAPEGAYPQMKVFSEVLMHIKADYVEEPDLKNVTLGALNGLLESIDPFASYLNAEQYKQYLAHRNTYKGDVGLVLSKRFGYVGVVSTLAGSPADKAGLATGDLIESIKGVSTRDMPLAYAELLLRGVPGTPVEISILRMRDPEPQKITLTRELIRDPPLNAKMLSDNIGYIRADTLEGGRTAEIAAAIRRLQEEGAKGLVLDLRQCATGDPKEGAALADLFLDKGLITYLEGQKVARVSFEASPSRTVTHLPLVVTTNRGTADGAEVAAAALLGNKRAEVVGERTFGDAAVRRAVDLGDGGAIILSVAKYYAPDGKAIQDTGVAPSVPFIEAEPVVEAGEEEGAAPETQSAPQTEQPKQDNLLNKAIEVLTHGASQKAQSGAGAAGTTPPPLTPLHVPRPAH